MWRRRRFSVPLRHQPQAQESLDTTAVVPTPGAVDGSGYGGPEPPATTQSASDSWGGVSGGRGLPLVALVLQWRQDYPNNRPPTRATAIWAMGQQQPFAAVHSREAEVG